MAQPLLHHRRAHKPVEFHAVHPPASGPFDPQASSGGILRRPPGTIPGINGVGYCTAILYIRDSQTDDVLQRVAEAARGYLDRFGDHIKSVYTAKKGGDEYQLFPFGDMRNADPLELMLRDPLEHQLIYSDSLTEDSGGEFEFAYLSGDEDWAHCGLLQIAVPARAMGGLEEPLSIYWRSLCELLQPIHGSGGLGLTVSLSRIDMQLHVVNNSIYRRHIEAWPCIEANARESIPVIRIDPSQGYLEWVRTTGWITVLGDQMLEKLGGKDAVATAAEQDSLVSAHPYSGGLMLKAGHWPILGDAASGPIPRAYGHIARLTKPVRNTSTRPDMLGSWGWNTYDERAEAWRQWRDRFDHL